MVSILAYELGMLLKKKFKLAIFNPLLISIAVVIVILAVFHIDYQSYANGAEPVKLSADTGDGVSGGASV